MRNKDPGGLCSTCLNIGFCINLKARGRGAVQCELFDSGITVVDLDRIPSMDAMLSAQTHEPCLGLCSTCEHVEKCAMAQPQGGVWHCEEYC